MNIIRLQCGIQHVYETLNHLFPCRVTPLFVLYIIPTNIIKTITVASKGILTQSGILLRANINNRRTDESRLKL